MQNPTMPPLMKTSQWRLLILVVIITVISNTVAEAKGSPLDMVKNLLKNRSFPGFGKSPTSAPSPSPSAAAAASSSSPFSSITKLFSRGENKASQSQEESEYRPNFMIPLSPIGYSRGNEMLNPFNSNYNTNSPPDIYVVQKQEREMMQLANPVKLDRFPGINWGANIPSNPFEDMIKNTISPDQDNNAAAAAAAAAPAAPATPATPASSAASTNDAASGTTTPAASTNDATTTAATTTTTDAGQTGQTDTQA